MTTYNRILVRVVFLFALARMFLKSGTGDSAILDAMFENSNLCDDVNVLTLNFISEKKPTKVFILTTNEATDRLKARDIIEIIGNARVL